MEKAVRVQRENKDDELSQAEMNNEIAIVTKTRVEELEKDVKELKEAVLRVYFNQNRQ